MLIKKYLESKEITAADLSATTGKPVSTGFNLIKSKKLVLTDDYIKQLKELAKNGVYIINPPTKLLDKVNGKVKVVKSTAKPGRPKLK